MAAISLLTPFAPFPPYAGGTSHIFHATRALSRYFDVSLYTLAEQPAEITWGLMHEWCSDLHAFARGTTNAQLWSHASTLDPPAVRQDRSDALATFVQNQWRNQPPAVVQLEFTTMAQYAPLARAVGALVVCTAHNVAFLAQLRRAWQERDLRVRARRLVGALSLWQYELRTLRDCDLVVTLSEVDANALRRWLPSLPVLHVRSGVDLEQWPACFNPQVTSQVLFVGSYSHPPNVEGAEWLVREVWPRVRSVVPNAQLTLAGKAPTPAIQALAAPDITVPGALPDLRPLYANASVVVAPIFWGSGVRIKLLEALASGVPVVTTALAAEDIGLVDGHNALFAETPAAFAAAIVRLLDDRALRERLGAAGRALIEQRYDWQQIGRQLAGVYHGLQPKSIRCEIV